MGVAELLSGGFSDGAEWGRGGRTKSEYGVLEGQGRRVERVATCVRIDREAGSPDGAVHGCLTTTRAGATLYVLLSQPGVGAARARQTLRRQSQQ